VRLTTAARETAVAVSLAVVAAVAGVSCSIWGAVTDDHSVVSAVLSATAVGAFVAMGVLVVALRPRNRVGWLMLGGGVLWAVGNGCVDLAFHGLVAQPGSLAAASAFAVIGSVARSAGWLLVVVAVPIVFPDGRLSSPRWSWLVKLFVAALVGSTVGALTSDDANLTGLGSWHNPLAVSSLQDLSGLVSLASVLIAAVAIGGAVLQLRARWRAGGQLDRQPIALLALAVAVPIVAAPVALLTGAGWVFSIAALPMPFAVAFGVLVRGLYDIRGAANRTLVWVTLSLVVAAVYALVIVGLGGLLDVGGASWLPWVAAAVVAVLFAPLRDALQRAVNRLTFGRWDEPYDVLAEIGQRLAAATDVDGLLDELVAELTALGLQAVVISDDHGIVAGSPDGASDNEELTLSAYGKDVGLLAFRSPVPPLRPRDRRLLEDLAAQLGGVLHARQLLLDLQGALERTVLAREEERRRLRRDLHDGLGPALAGHLLRLDVIAGQLAPSDGVRLEIDQLRCELRATVGEVRRVVEGLRPAALDELGLAGALTQIGQRLGAGTSTDVVVRIGALPSLPAAVEVAAYRIASEAMTNSVRHAQARTCQVDVATSEGWLCVEITDDGCGFAPTTVPGNGLQTMRERAEELRGRLAVESASGTTIRVDLPLPRGGRRSADRAVRVRR
jgi:signal transduction histidine kinase